jgi:hypothetical protein
MSFSFNPTNASNFNFGGQTLGAPVAPTQQAAAPSATTFSFGQAAPAAAPVAPSQQAAAPSATTFSFGQAAPQSTGQAFGQAAPAPSTAAPAPVAPQPSTTFNFSLNAPSTITATAPPQATATTSSSSSSSSTVPSLKVPVEKSLEDSETLVDIMKRWKLEIENQKEEFVKQSKQVIEWDTSLRSARVGLTRLSDDVSRLNKEQEDIESSLTHVGNHNTRLKNMLEEIERYLDFRLGAGQNGEAPESASQATAQAARAEAYDSARRIESLLSVLGNELQSVNDLISKGLSSQIENPLDKAKVVLAAEVNSLGDIERASNEVLERAKKLRAQAQMYKR